MKRFLLIFLQLVLTGIPVKAANYYWVGGSGNWSDFANRWATTPGGNSFHNKAPSAEDNVFFTSHSFPATGATVTIDVDAWCLDMHWIDVANQPALAGSSSRKLYIGGALSLSQGMDFTFSGDVFFRASSPASAITMAGKSFRRNVYFQGDGGWELQDAFSQTGSSFTVHLERGILNTNNQDFTVCQFDSDYTHIRSLVLGNSTFTITNGNFRFRGENFSFQSGTSTLIFKGSSASIQHVSYLGNGLSFHHVIFENTNQGAYVATRGGTFNSLVFHGNATLWERALIEQLSFLADGTINGQDHQISNLLVKGHATLNGNNTYGTVNMKGNASITGNNIFDKLNLSPGREYVLTSGRTQLISEELNAPGTASEHIIMRSATEGSASSFSKSSGNIQLSYCYLRDIHATGGAVFNAVNSINLGNNTGWNISSPSSKSLYWVGGSGNWSDPEKWALQGGQPANCIPTAVDDVFFNSASFSSAAQKVTITGDGSNSVYCRSMNWSGVLNNPSLEGSSQTKVNIFGSLTLSPGMSFAYDGELIFKGSTQENKVFTAGKILDRNHLYFDGTGSWDLMDALNLGSRTLYLVRGSLNTNDQAVRAGRIHSNYQNNIRSLKLGSSVVTLINNAYDAIHFHGNNMSLQAGTSLIRFTGQGAGIYNLSGEGLFFNDVIFEATTGNNNVYNNRGGFNHVIFHSTGDCRLHYGNTVDSVFFAGTGSIYSDFNNIRRVIFSGNATLSGSNSTFGSMEIPGEASLSGNSTYKDLIIRGNASIGGNNTFDHLLLGANTSITGNNSISILELSAGKQYTFTSARTQTIRHDLLAQGTELEPIIIRSATAGTRTSFSKESGTVTLEYVSLRDIQATGGAIFLANNSYDMGNNLGWTINPPPGKTFFWVGGTGSWNNPANWSLDSDGSGGAGIPSKIDQVVFDKASFKAPGHVVSLAGDVAGDIHCLNLDFSLAEHAFTLAGASSQNLRIHGSLDLNSQMSWSFDGPVYFHSDAQDNTINSRGVILEKNHLYFDGTGSWDLMDALNLGSRTLYLVRGSLNTNDQAVRAGRIHSNYQNNIRSLKLGSSVVTLINNAYDAIHFHGNNMSLQAGTSLIRFTGQGAGIYNLSGEGLFFNDVIFEATTGNNNVYNNRGGFNHVIFHSTGDCGLHYGNTVDSLHFMGNGNIASDHNNIRRVIFNREASIASNGTYGHVTMNRSGTISGNNTFDVLEFTPGNIYTLTSNRTQTIMSDLLAQGSCFAPIMIRSSSTAQTFLRKTSGTVEIMEASLQGIHASGGADFIAGNTVDAGNNHGWIFTQSPKVLYWVGGTGNWDNFNHWSAESGGQGGYCVPSQVDHVIFDQNSFTQAGQAVFINIENARCHSMDWSDALHAPTFTSTSSNYNLRIFGSLKLNAQMNFSFPGIIYFEGDATGQDPASIFTAGKTFNNQIHFSSASGAWRLDDNFNTGNNELHLVAGRLITNGKTVSCSRFHSLGNLIRTLDLGASQLILSSSSAYAWNVGGSNFNIIPGTSEIRLTAAGSGFNSTGNSNLTYNNVIFQNPGGTSSLTSSHSFNQLTFNPKGFLTGGGLFQKVTFHSEGEIGDGNHRIEQAHFLNNGIIRGNNTFGILTIAAGRSLRLESGRTQTLTQDMQFWGSSASPIQLNALTAGSQATLLKTDGTISGNYIHLKDIHASGGATFQVYNAQNLGNNTGWLFPDPPFATCPDPQQLCITVPSFELSMALPAGGHYRGAGVYFQDNAYWFSPAIAGEGEKVLIYELEGFESSCELLIQVLPLPQIICRQNIEVKAGAPYITLYEGEGTYSHNGKSITGFDPIKEGTFTITYSVSNECGVASCEFLIIVGPPILVEITGEKDVCAGEATTLTVSEGLSYLWSTGETTQSITVSKTGKYSVQVFYEDNYIAKAEAQVTVHPLPLVTISGPAAFCGEQTLVLAASEGQAYIWNTAETSPNISISLPGHYWVEVTDEKGCKAQAHKTVAAFPGFLGEIMALMPYDDTYGIKDPITFSWTEAENVESYDLYIWRNTDPRPESPTVKNLKTNSHKYTPYLNKNFAYHWQAEAKNICFIKQTGRRFFSFQVLTDLVVEEVSIPENATAGETLEVTYRIRNTGSISTGMIPWKDELFISSSPTFSLQAATKLATTDYVSTLGPGDSYAKTITITLPRDIEGNYYIWVRADAANDVSETDEANNIGRAEQALFVSYPPYPDLAVSGIQSLNGTIVPGDPVTIGWTVTNEGNAAAIGGWSQRVAMVSGSKINILGYVQHKDHLEASASVSGSATFLINKVPDMEGDVYLEVRLTPNPGLKERPNSTANNIALSQSSILLEKRLALSLDRGTITENASSPLQGLVQRSGNREMPLVLNLVASAENRIQLPQNLTIPAGQSGVSFGVLPVDNNLTEGNIELQISADAPDYPGTQLSLVVVDDEIPLLSLSLDREQASEGENFQLTVTRNLVNDQPLEVKLSAMRKQQLQLPPAVVIASHEASLTINVPVVDDDIPELDEDVEIQATAPGYRPGWTIIHILDNDLPQLSLSLNPTVVSEGAGQYAAWGTIRISEPAKNNMVILLSADKQNQIFFPSQVTISKGSTQQQFKIGVIDNNLVDGDRDVMLQSSIYLSSCGCGAPVESDASASAMLTITDNDGPALSLEANPFVVPENITNAGKLTLTRNTMGGPEISVMIIHDGQDVLDIPSSAIFPEGVSSIEVPFHSLDDGTDAGDRIVTIRITAEGYSQGSCWIQVKDQNLPDFLARGISLSQPSILINSPVNISLYVVNNGFSLGPQGAEVSIYRSKDNRLDRNDLLIATVFTQRALQIRDSVLVSFTYTPDDQVGDFFIIAEVNAKATLKELTGINNTSDAVPLQIRPDYTATATVSGDVFNGTAPIVITGFTQTVTKSPVPNKPVDVYIVVNGVRRTYSATSDQNGQFSLDFIPVNGEAGEYYVGACYPGQSLNQAQDNFSIMGARHTETGFIKWDLRLDHPKDHSLEIQNLSAVNLSNLRLEVVSAPDGVHIDFTPLGQLAGNSTATLNYTVTASEVTIGSNYREVKLRLVSSQGTVFRFSTWVFCQASRGNLKLEPARLSRTMVRDQINHVEFDFLNNGLDETGEIIIHLPNAPWMSINGPSLIPSLKPGERAAVTLRLSPGEELQLHNPISGNIGLTATNANSVSLPFTFEPVSSHSGMLLVDVVNEYTYNTSEAPHLQGASVTITHPYTGQIVAQGVSDANGHFLAEDLREGFYNLKVQAARHSSYQNMVYVEKGITRKETVFLAFQAITWSWEVVPTRIKDQYEITLVTVFETNVPAPVVEMIMPDTIPHLNHGETFPFLLVLANHGLITAKNVHITLPDDSEYEFNANVNTLDIMAKSSVHIPVVVRRRTQKSEKSISCTGFTLVKYQFECGPDDQIRLTQKKVTYQGRVCAPVVSGGIGGGIPAIPIGGGIGPGHWGGGGSGGTGGGIGEVVPYRQSKVGCDPCLIELLNALWGCSPIPQTGFGKRLSVGAVAGAVGAVRGFIGNVTCAFGIGYSIGCKINQHLKDFGKKAPSELATAQKDMDMFVLGTEAMAGITREVFGNDEMLYKNNLDLLADAITIQLEEFASFNPDDVNELMIVMAGSDILIDEIQNFVNRWNISMEAWNQGIYSPTTEYPAIVDTLVIHAHAADLETALAYARGRGYNNLAELFNAAYYLVDDFTQQSSSAVCATVTVQFSQTMTMTREAFEGTLKIFNGHDTDAMENIRLSLEIRDQEGVDCTHLFQINPGALRQISAVDGTGRLAAQTEGSAVVIFIPEKAAAPEVPKYYSFGGSFSYLDPFTGQLYEQKLFPVTLQVNPSPDLYINYFMQRDILGDDALTEAIEPSIPAEMAVMIHNRGFGTAWEVNIESAQPKIIDNQKGLMVDFEIVGSNLGGKPRQLGLLNVDFGDIDPGDIAVGQWWFTSSLLGHFISYEVSVNHLNSFGNPNLSLVSSVEIHELIRSVRVYGPLDDGINDFLVNNIPDREDIPDALYYSNGTVAAVHRAEKASIKGQLSVTNLLVELDVTPYVSGWNYGRLDDPGNGMFHLVGCTREDGQEIPLDNIWQTHVTIPDGGEPIYENKLHFLDLFADGNPYTYTLVFEPKQTDIPEVVSIEGVPAGIADTPVKNLQVVFNKPIDAASFDYQDMVLRNQGGTDLMDATVEVSQLSDVKFNVNLAPKTSDNGYYLFTVQAAGITDLMGNAGQTGKQVHWIQAFSAPAITHFLGLPKEPCQKTDTLVVKFNMPVLVETFTTAQLQLIRGADNIQVESLTITALDEMQTLFRIGGLLPLTSDEGDYRLTIVLPEIKGETGNYGSVEQWVEWRVCTLYNLVLEASPLQGGTLSGQGAYSAGTQVHVTATPCVGYHFVNWTGDIFLADDPENPAFTLLMPQADVSLTANFSINIYQIQAEASHPDHGHVQGAGLLSHGQQVSLQAIPATGYHFIRWTENDKEISRQPLLEFPAVAHRNLTAHFAINRYSITAASANPGFGTVFGSGDYDHFEKVILRAIPEVGYHFESWQEGDEVVSYMAEYIFSAEKNRDLLALFALTSVSVGVNPQKLDFEELIIGHCLTQSFRTVGTDLYDLLEIRAPEGFLVSLQQASGFLQQISLQPQNGTVDQEIYVRFCPEDEKDYSALIFLLTSGSAPVAVEVTGSGAWEKVALDLNLGKGYTWFSVNVNPGNLAASQMLQGLIICENDQVIAQDKYISWLQGQWSGELNLLPGRSYIMNLCNAQSHLIRGRLPEAEVLDLPQGITWLGYTPRQAMSVNTALAALMPGPGNNDRIIAQNSFAVFHNGQWTGSLQNLNPGEGYVLDLSQASSLLYPQAPEVEKGQNKPSGVFTPAGIQPLANLRHTMTLLAELKYPGNRTSTDSRDVVYAFSGDECRGMASPTELQQGKIFMSIGSNLPQGETITFRVWSAEYQTMADITGSITYEELSAKGSMISPWPLEVDASISNRLPGQNPWYIGNPFPNPFRTSTQIPFMAEAGAEVTLMIYNSLGTPVKKIQQQAEVPGLSYLMLDKAQLPPGVYLYFVEIKGYNRKTVQKKGRLIIMR